MLETLSLSELVERLVNHEKWQVYWDKPGNENDTSDSNHRNAHAHINSMESTCAELEFDVDDCIRRIRKRLDEGTKGSTASHPLSFYWMELYNRILHESKKHVFAYIPQERASFFEPDALFGYDVEYSFPNAASDITAASSCYAVGAYTACVFHLMRSVEIGARVLVSGLKAHQHLKRPVQLCDWGDLIAALQEGIKVLRVGSRTTLAKKEKYEFYNHAVAQFLNFKDAWRNNVSHTRKVYSEGAARDIMDNTRQFMQHLATKLKERR